MNTDTNMLYKSKEEALKMGELMKNLTVVPDHLQGAAEKKLDGKTHAQVSHISGGQLSRFASRQRKKKRRMQKQSRKANR